jgi:hypothetical protein
MVGLAQDADRSADRMDRFHEQLALYRKRLRDSVTDSGAFTLRESEHQALVLERELDNLLMQAADLAREPLQRHMAMAMAMQHAVSLAPSLPTVYPEPRKGAPGLVTSTTPYFTIDGVHVLERMVSDFLKPGGYTSRFPGYKDFPAGVLWFDEPGSGLDGFLHQSNAFINDVIHLHDNPKGVKPVEPGQ